MRGLHFGALDRSRTPSDTPPENVLSADVAPTARKFGAEGGVAVYLARGRGFVCLGVDGGGAHYGVAHQCMLNVSVANQGLWVRVSSDKTPSSNEDTVGTLDNESILVVAVPDHADLLTSASTERLASYVNAAVLRPQQDEILLQPRGQAPISINRSIEATFSASC